MNTSLSLLAVLALRNPFWPIGYEGTREAISAEPVVAVKQAATNEIETAVAAAVAADALAPESDDPTTRNARLWQAARNALRIGSVGYSLGCDGTRRQSVMINEKIYGNGDILSVNHDGCRFTWRFEGLTERKTLRLVRLRLRELDTEDEKKGTRP